jgi:limonene-1,2-epoxide hydrolase
MDELDFRIARRQLFVAGGAAAVAALAFADRVEAAPLSAVEKANSKLVEDFCLGWMAKNYDADREMAKFLSADSAVRMVEDKPPVIGPAAVAAEMKGFTASGQSVDVEMLEIFAKGPVVVTSRVDTVKASGKPDQVYKIAGVFIVKGGKITEWTDFLAT